MSSQQGNAMNSDQFNAALEQLGLRPSSKTTAELLGLSVRQLQRLSDGSSKISGPIIRLLLMYHQHGLPEANRSVTGSRSPKPSSE